ncbi:MAG: hypothetical protein ACD_34C00653G0001, partial [uncultured bacterium]
SGVKELFLVKPRIMLMFHGYPNKKQPAVEISVAGCL